MDPSVYLNWILYSLYGLMSEADALRRQYRHDIDRVARVLRERHPVTPRPLYRGMLLDNADSVRPEPNLTFLSWSEDRDVARWFGHPAAFISEPFVMHYPWVQGFVITAPKAPTPVLWHHSWREAFGAPLEWLALRHPLLGAEGARQVAWSLDTQQEVICEPPADVRTLPRPEPVEDVPGAPIEELNRRLSPPWTVREAAS